MTGEKVCFKQTSCLLHEQNNVSKYFALSCSLTQHVQLGTNAPLLAEKRGFFSASELADEVVPGSSKQTSVHRERAGKARRQDGAVTFCEGGVKKDLCIEDIVRFSLKRDSDMWLWRQASGSHTTALYGWGSGVCVWWGVGACPNIPKQHNRQLDGNQLNSCYENDPLCFHPTQLTVTDPVPL